MTAGIDPAANARTISDAIRDANSGGASMLFTPEMANLIDRDATRSAAKIRREEDDLVLSTARRQAARWNISVCLGSLALLGDNGRLVNRSIVIGPGGDIAARYDKMHLFDVDLPTGESWRESARYVAGDRAVTSGPIGLSICYDLRFPALYQALSEAGAHVLAIPSAFTVPTGEAHWHVLNCARAIENACFVVAAAQTGEHEDGRVTYGHSLVIDPWGRVLLDMGEGPGLAFVDLDLADVDAVRARVPVLAHRRPIAPVSVQ